MSVSTKRRSVRMAGIVVLAVGMGSLAACATPANSVQMTLPATATAMAPPRHPAYRSVTSVSVTGGKSTNPLWMSQVSGEDFRVALEASLDQAGYVGAQGRPISVEADLLRLDRPLYGVDLAVTSHVRYRVSQEGRLVFDETVSASGSAGLGDALIASQRLRVANENSIQQNIRLFLTRFGRQAYTSGH